jgi:hypothetical protein
MLCPLGLPLQGPVSGSKKPAIDGQLIILAAGDESLFHDAKAAFGVMGKKSLYLGAVGAGARMKLVVNMVMGSMMGGWTAASVMQAEALQFLTFRAALCIPASIGMCVQPQHRLWYEMASCCRLQAICTCKVDIALQQQQYS